MGFDVHWTKGDKSWVDQDRTPQTLGKGDRTSKGHGCQREELFERPARFFKIQSPGLRTLEEEIACLKLQFPSGMKRKTGWRVDLPVAGELSRSPFKRGTRQHYCLGKAEES